MGKGAEGLIPLLIVGGILIFKALRAFVDQQNTSRPRSGDTDWQDDKEGDWEEWDSSTTQKQGPAPQPAPATIPSARVASILAALERQQKKEPPPVAATRPEPPTVVEPAAPAPQPLPSRKRTYLSEDNLVETAAAEVRQVAQSTRDVIDESMAVAFPAAKAAVRQARTGTHRAIRVRAQGRSNLRRGILLSEILGPPRAFDL